MCRFINADGYVSTGQGNAGINMYSYCGNNPVNRIDSNGRFFEGIGRWLKKAWNGIKTFFKNTFGAGSSTTVQKYDVYTENAPEPFNAVVSQKTGRKKRLFLNMETHQKRFLCMLKKGQIILFFLQQE